MTKKTIFFTSLALFTLLFLTYGTAQAQVLVPCGQGDPTNPDGTPNREWKRCELSDVFVLIKNIYNFIVFYISTPLAGLMVVIGGVMLIVSAGNPGLAARGRSILWWTLIAILLIWGAWLIINTLLLVIGVNI